MTLKVIIVGKTYINNSQSRNLIINVNFDLAQLGFKGLNQGD